MMNEPNKKFLADIKMWRIKTTDELDDGELDELECTKIQEFSRDWRKCDKLSELTN